MSFDGPWPIGSNGSAPSSASASARSASDSRTMTERPNRPPNILPFTLPATPPNICSVWMRGSFGRAARNSGWCSAGILTHAMSRLYRRAVPYATAD